MPHAEITYGALDSGTRALIKQNAELEEAGTPVAYAGVSAQQVKKQIKAAQRLLDFRIADWQSRYTEEVRALQSSPGWAKAGSSDTDARRKVSFVKWLNAEFKTTVQVDSGMGDRTIEMLDGERICAGVLIVLGETPATYGFLKATASPARGLAFLQANDPKLKQPKDLPDPSVKLDKPARRKPGRPAKRKQPPSTDLMDDVADGSDAKRLRLVTDMAVDDSDS